MGIQQLVSQHQILMHLAVLYCRNEVIMFCMLKIKIPLCVLVNEELEVNSGDENDLEI
jgi:hypothetical protein